VDPATDRGILTRDPQMHGFINREDVAELVARVLEDPATAGQMFAAVDVETARTANPIPHFDLRGLSNSSSASRPS
jgi:uncharacterized protein YbjT (DUF2867 family)